MCGMLAAVHQEKETKFSKVLRNFSAPISINNCGEKCAPYNEQAVPFCCDIQHTVPTVYLEEWKYLKSKTDLWHQLKTDEISNYKTLKDSLPSGQIMVACQGSLHCQREYRAVTCRSFPFFPYINQMREFIGLSYYWEFEDRCWIISNLDAVERDFVDSFVLTYDLLLKKYPHEIDNFRYITTTMHEEFSKWGRAIPLIHRNGNFYKISPVKGRLRKCSSQSFLKFGPYKLAQALPFPDEE